MLPLNGLMTGRWLKTDPRPIPGIKGFCCYDDSSIIEGKNTNYVMQKRNIYNQLTRDLQATRQCHLLFWTDFTIEKPISYHHHTNLTRIMNISPIQDKWYQQA